MLKWLKQKPNGHHHHNSHSSSHNRSPHHQGSHHDAGQNKIITDDPLATIQVHPQHQKKSKNKSEEIYAVSRVNPLFEEEDIPIKPISVGVDAGSRGNNSGSSGYDSGSTSDDGELSKFHRRSNLHHPDSSSTSSTSSFSVVNRAPSKHGQLFRDDDDPVVHHQAAILGPNGRPVLHIVEQNPDFVQSIAVAVGSAGRPLSPINELGNNNESSRSSSAIPRNHHHGGHGKVNVHPVPTRSRSNSSGEDYLGVAKLIQKDNKFVHSIQVGNGKGSIRVSHTKPSSSEQSKHEQLQQQPSRVITSSNTPYPPVTRKPSVTFSERVELVLDDNGNGKLLVKSGGGNIGAIPYRKASTEQDSIVTESLLLMTSSRPTGTISDNATGVSNNANNSNSNNNSKLFNNSSSNNNPSKSSSDGVHQLPPSHRKVSTDSTDSENFNNASSAIINRTGSQRREDLEAFSTSIRKNHPVKHILSNSGKSLEISAAADQYSSTEFLDACNAVGDIDSRHYKPSYSEEYSSTSSDDASASSHPNHRDQISRNHYQVNGKDTHHQLHDESTRSSSHSPATTEDEEVRSRRPTSGKSPFGGIADHYAAAKEIAKEIESYSNGDANANKSSKKSIVRELLSGRGREALHLHNYSKADGNHVNDKMNGSSPSGQNKLLSPRHSAGGVASQSAKEAWESVRVQQVYLKGRSWKEIQPSSSSSTSSQEGDAGQRVLSVVQQGQVHTNKSNNHKDRNTTNSAVGTNTTLQQSTKQLLKGSIYDGHSSEGGTSNNEGDDDASSDSGHSTDQNSKGSRKDLITERRTASSSSSRPKGLAPKPPDPISSIEEDTTSIDKVMIVTGDSKNMVVDLSGVPQDLRDAIIAGTALITLPDGLKSSVSKKGGYTIVSIPTPTNSQSKSKSKMNASSSSNNPTNSNPNASNAPTSSTTPTSTHHHPPPPTASTSSSSRLPETTSVNLKSGHHQREIEVKAIPIPSSEDLSKLEMGELYGHIFNNYGTKNKAQMWEVMQQSVQQTLIEDEKGKKKRITTVLPFHPNQDVYKSPDFTMEGQRQERQRKKLDFAKRRRCVCRVFGILFFLATFIGVLVALSMIYTKGQRYFGSA